jgi:hypothetical protein
MMPQFIQHPLPYYRSFGSMMKNVYLPEAEKNLALQSFCIFICHNYPSITTTIYDNRNNIKRNLSLRLRQSLPEMTGHRMKNIRSALTVKRQLAIAACKAFLVVYLPFSV